MTTTPTPATSTNSSRSIDLARVCVTARAVLAAMPDLVAEGLTDRGVERLTVHAPGQADFQSGAQIAVSLPVAKTHVFDTGDSQNALSRR